MGLYKKKPLGKKIEKQQGLESSAQRPSEWSAFMSGRAVGQGLLGSVLENVWEGSSRRKSHGKETKVTMHFVRKGDLGV